MAGFSGGTGDLKDEHRFDDLHALFAFLEGQTGRAVLGMGEGRQPAGNSTMMEAPIVICPARAELATRRRTC